MDTDNAQQAPQVTPQSCPILPTYVKLHNDKARDRWVLLAPERVLEPDDTALEIIRLCDGKTSVTAIAEELGRRYEAPAEQIQGDITAMLQDLLDKRFLELG